jgi:NAD(P)-dependent dehydrogenase (short-subunit alcohol dehydrogenase family)
LAIITGGGRGLGLAFARGLLQKNMVARVALLDLAGAASAAWGLEKEFGIGCARGWTCNVCDIKMLETVYKSAAEWAAFSGHTTRVVINNAGIVSQGLNKCELAVAVNLTAVIEGTGFGWELMKEHGGTIINVASFGAFVPMPFSPVYAATKAAVVALSRSCEHLASPTSDALTGGETVHRHGKVHVVALCPAFTNTNMVRDPMAAEKGRGPFSAVVGMQGGIMTPEHIASHVVQVVASCNEAIARDDDESCELAGQALVILPKRSTLAQPPSIRGDKFEVSRECKL